MSGNVVWGTDFKARNAIYGSQSAPAGLHDELVGNSISQKALYPQASPSDFVAPEKDPA